MFDLRSCWRAKLGAWDIAVALAVAGWFALFVFLSVLQYETGHSRSFDLALYARSLWGLAHDSPINPLRDQHVLALHGHWILYPLAPVARVASSVYILLTLQALAIAAGAAASYHVAARRLDSKATAFAIAVMYLSYPVAANAVLFDMHVKTLAVPFLILAIDRFDRVGWHDVGAWALLAVAFSCREEIALAVGIMGATWLLFEDKRPTGMALAVAGIALFGLYYFVVQPGFGTDAASAQAHLGHLRGGGLVTQLATAQNATLALFSLGSLAFLPLIGWRFSVGASVAIGIAMLSRWPGAADPTSHYLFLAMPFLILGVIEALVLIRRATPRAYPVAIAAGIVCSLVSYAATGTGPAGRHFDPERYSFTPTSLEAILCLDLIPKGVPALAPDHLVAHLAERASVVTSLRSPEQSKHLKAALLDVDVIAWMHDAPGYASYLASRRSIADHLQRDLGFAHAQRCGPYIVLLRD